MTKAAFLKLALKIAISITILVILTSQIKPEHLTSTLKKLSLLDLFLALTLYLAAQFISAFRWRVLANSMGIGGSLMEYYNYYLKGMFFNLFMPTSIGGDLGRAVLLSRKEHCSWLQAFLSILCERFCGLIGMITYASVGILVLQPPKWEAYGIFALTVFVAAATFTFGFRWIDRKHLGHLLIQKFILKKHETAEGEPAAMWPTTQGILKAVGISILFHSTVVSIQMFIMHELHGNAHFMLLASIYALGALASMIPVSFNGIGLREGSMTLLLLQWTPVTKSVATAFSLVWLSILLLSAIPGGILILIDQFYPTKKDGVKPT